MVKWFTSSETDDPAVGAESYLGTSPHPSATDEFDRTEPQAFLVRYPASVGPLRVHWHPVPQFQYIVSGDARFGAHDVRPGTVHYADPGTPYGPLAPDGDRVCFLTLRASNDRGAEFMPEAQAQLGERRALEPDGAPHRNVTASLDDVAPGIVASDDDGMQIEVIDLDADQSITIDPGVTGAYVVVVHGAIVDDDGVVRGDPASLCFLAQPESVLAAALGSRLAVLRFPVRALSSVS